MIVWSSMPNLGYPPQGNCHIEAKQVLLILGQLSRNPKPYSSFKIVIQLQFGHFVCQLLMYFDHMKCPSSSLLFQFTNQFEQKWVKS
jgi:hypothetical protein